MLEGLTISNAVIVTFALVFLFSIALPIVLLIIWKKKNNVSARPALIGMAIFILFAMIAEQIVHFLVIGLNETVSGFILSRPWLYALYSGLVAGVFEETGRFVAFKTMLKDDIGRENAITYGIGHGGIECVFVLGMTMLSNFMVALMFNSMGAETFVAQYAPEQADTVVQTIQAIQDINVFAIGLACFERICALILQVELSVLVFAAVRLKKIWMYLLAILAHMAINFFAAQYQAGVLNSAILMEVVIGLYVAALAYPIYRLYKRLPMEAPIELDHFGRPMRRKNR